MIKANALKECFATDSVDTKMSIFSHNNQNIVIGGVDEDCIIPTGVENLAYKMMIHDKLIREYIISLRNNYISKCEDFSFSLEGKADEEKKLIIDIFQNLYGIVTMVHYCPHCEVLKGKIALTTKAHNFILGQYMEIAIYKSVKDILLDLSNKYNKKFNIYRNVKVSTKNDGKIKNEFDLVIESSEKIVYVIEVKTGYSFRDFNRYTEVGKRYGIVPDRFLLVDNCLTLEHCETIEYFCEYLVSNLENNSFSEKLITMIEKDI